MTVVQQMVRQHDLKLQGPAASGTHDTLYHGVFYYYLIAPWVWLGQGNPQVVVNFLAVLSAGSVGVAFVLGKQVFASTKIGLLAAILTAGSFLQAELGTWLSNPQTLVLSIGLFYLFLWRCLGKKSHPLDWLGLGITLGLSIQAGLFEITLGGSLLAAYLFKAVNQKKWHLFTRQQLGLFGGGLLATTATMILTQLLMIQRGVMTFNNLPTIGSASTSTITLLSNLLGQYLDLLHNTLAPQGPILVVLMLLIPVWIGWSTSKPAVKFWVAIFLTGPLWLLTLQYRNLAHLFAGLELVVILLLAKGLQHLGQHVFAGKTLVAILVALYLSANLGALHHIVALKENYFGFQKGTFLIDQLGLVDQTYRLADNQPFSFSATTNPYGINVTWSYLYHWYGLEKHGYLPAFYGNPQAGYPGEGLVPEADRPLPHHFTILEPDTGLAAPIEQEFLAQQTRMSSAPTQTLEFGSLRLQVR